MSLTQLRNVFPAQPPTALLVSKKLRVTRSTHKLYEGIDRITLVDIQKFDDGFISQLELVQFAWTIGRPDRRRCAAIAKGMYSSVRTKEPLNLRTNNEGKQTGSLDDKRTNGTDEVKEPLAITVTERKFGQTWLHHPGCEDGRPIRRSSTARSGSAEIFN